jgi:putative tricarboxylic transport membrane protein
VRPAIRGGTGLHHDVIVGLVLLGFCGLCYWLTSGFDELPMMLAQNVPPTFFPRLVLGLVATLAVLLIAGGLRRTKTAHERVKPIVYVTAVVVVATPALLEPLGTWPTLFLVTAALPLLWGERRRRRVLALAALLPVAVYVVFTLALDVRFPPGIFAGL